MITRSDFLKLLALLGAVGLAGRAGGAETPQPASPTPGSPTGSPDATRDFLRAVSAGDAARVREALARDPGLAVARDESGRSALVLAYLGGAPLGHTEVAGLLRPHLADLDLVEAVLEGDGDRVRALLEASPGLLEQTHPIGGRPIHVAARFGRPQMVFALLAADFNTPAVDGRTALRLAAEFPDAEAAEEMVEALASNQADPNVPQPDGRTPLHAAAAEGRTEMARILILNGARPEARDREGRTPLDLARRANRAETQALLARADTLPRNHRTSRFAYNASGEPFRPQPITAARAVPQPPQPLINQYVGLSHGNLAKVRELLQANPGLLYTDANWSELSVEAGAHVGYRELVQFQLDQGAPLSLCTAAMMGKAAFVKRLLAEDPKRIWEHGAHNFPPLWFAAVGGRPDQKPDPAAQLEVTKVLLDAGADIDAHKRGRTALHFAAQTGQVELAELLLARGANPNTRTRGKDSETPLSSAEKNDQKITAALLRKHGARA
jgi:uncharacterized protein